MSEGRISGTLAAAVTPLRDGGERLDEEAFGPLLEFYGGRLGPGERAPRCWSPRHR